MNEHLCTSTGLISILSAITIHLPDHVASFQRCPEHGATDSPAIQSYADQTFCNVYHTCNCTRTGCQIVESHVCPIAKVYSKTRATCLGSLIFLPSSSCIRCFSHCVDIEGEGCETTYVQWVQTHSAHTDQNMSESAIIISDSLLPSSSSGKDFRCEQGQPGKFR